MEPNFLDRDYLIIYEAGFRVLKEPPERGAVVVFRYPKDPSQYFIKRVIGLPQETVEIREGKVYITNDGFPKGVLLRENEYLSEDEMTTVAKGTLRMTLGEGEYFLLGDNRSQSLDSRVFGPVHYDSIIGRTWIRGFPFHRISTFNTPEYRFQ
jgi:signal peptidase I